jgi:hypothetical protein
MIKLLDLLPENTDRIEIKNINYYQQILNMSSNISISTRNFFQSVIDSIKKQNNFATRRQHEQLLRLKSGDFKYHSKN